MNSNWLPTLLGTVVVGLVPLIVWYMRRHDRVAEQMRENIALIDDLRRDFWDLEDYVAKQRTRWRRVQERWHDLQEQLKTLEVINEIEDLDDMPPLPEPRVSRHRDDEPPRWFRRRQDDQGRW